MSEQPQDRSKDEDEGARQEVNPDLHGQAAEVAEKRAKGDPEATGA
ncbi:hypothetical protein [Actinomycetospora atypica]|uniref:Nucleotide exchange factor GrpE n=1 Tax=Actinomycetospora atypica TaxID=1290095 RepID=A0ABV9YR32_9PSEU